MQKKHTISSTESILEKLKSFLGLKSGLDLANYLEVKANTVSSWKTRNSMPYYKIIEVCYKNNINLNELLYDEYLLTPINYVEVPILNLNNHWDYFYNKRELLKKLPTALFPKEIDIDIIIQISIDSVRKIDSKLIYCFCKKTEINNLKEEHSYIVMVRDKGFLYYNLIENKKKSATLLFKDITQNKKEIAIKVNDILEIFLFQG